MTAYTEEERALIWLCACSGLEVRECCTLFRAADGDPVKLFREFEKFAGPVIKKERNGLYKEGNCQTREEELSAALAHMERCGYFAVTAVSADFPEPLVYADPPLVLFGQGRRELLKRQMFCIVGSRTTPSWAFKLGTALSEALSREFVIVTGLAEGGDLAAVRGALGSGNLVSVLPCGLDECYPADHTEIKREIAKKGLLLSERPFAEKVRPGAFQARNRILAGLSVGTLVLSAGEKSGTLITAGKALQYGRDVFAIPYNPGIVQGVGCNNLIKAGACLVSGAEDILAAYGKEAPSAAPEGLTEDEAQALSVLRQEGELHAAVLAEKLGKPAFEVAAILSSLELKGLAAKSGGNRYAIV